MSLGQQIFWGVFSSVVAAAIVWCIWWVRIWFVARLYCGQWTALKFENRRPLPMEGNGSASIRRAFTSCPCSWVSPENLICEASYDGSIGEGRIELQGDITINPFAPNHAFVTLHRVGDKIEYAVQEYFVLRNGDIYVVPVVSERVPPDYNKHVLRRRDD
jgi:hypothetical protein